MDYSFPFALEEFADQVGDFSKINHLKNGKIKRKRIEEFFLI
jgi:hypothetical protein